MPRNVTDASGQTAQVRGPDPRGGHVPVTAPSHYTPQILHRHCSTARDDEGGNSVQKSYFLVENISCLSEQNPCNTDKSSALHFLSYFPQKGINSAQSRICMCTIQAGALSMSHGPTNNGDHNWRAERKWQKASPNSGPQRCSRHDV